MNTTRILAALGVALQLALALVPDAAMAQSPNTDTYFYTPGGGGVNGAVGMCLNSSSPPRAVPCSDPSALPSPVSGTFSATLSGFTPNGNYATLTATASSSGSTAMPAGAVVAFQNTSTVDVSCVLSAGAATATTNKIVVRGGSSVFLTVGSNVNAACINQTGSASNVVVMAGGTGLGTNFGGGSGGGGGGAVFGPTANGSAAANPPVLMGGTANGTATGNVGNWKVDSSGTGWIDAVSSGNLLTAINSGIITNGSAPPSTSIWLGANASGATGGHGVGLIICDSHVFKHITSATDTLAVQGVASQTIYICSWRSRAAGVATWFLENTASANANCSSANTQINGVATEAANTGEIRTSTFYDGLKNTSGNGLCINSTGTGGVDVDVWYAQF